MFTLNLVEHAIGSLLFYEIFYRRASPEKSKNKFFKDVVWICIIQAIIILSSLASEDISKFFISLNKEADDVRDLLRRYSGLRGNGLASGLTFDLSVVFAIGMIFNSIVRPFTMSNPSILINLVFLFCIFITGRTGLIFLILYCFMVGYKSPRMYYLAIPLGITLVFGALFVSQVASPAPFFLIIQFALEPIYSLFGVEGIQSASTDRLTEMWTELADIPLKTFLHGDGYWRDPDNINKYYMAVDPGYLRTLYYGGIPYTILIYLSWLMLILLTPSLDYKIKIVALLFCLIEIKGSFIFGSGMTAKLFYLWLIVQAFNNEKTSFNSLSRVA
jgi:hypothetical protein